MAKKMKSTAKCKCLEAADKELREHYGATFKRSLTMNFDTMQAGIAGPFLAIEWVANTRSNRKLPTVECAYCPFCGKKKP
jgi:hypothetical protein